MPSTGRRSTTRRDVDEFHAERRQEDVRRLEIAMHETAPMERLERIENGQLDLDRFCGRERAPGDSGRQRLALEQLYRNVELAVLFAEIVKLADIGMTDTRRRASLTHEAVAGGRVGLAAPRLDCHSPVELLVMGGIHNPHAALADLPGHAETSVPLSHRSSHSPDSQL
jgi:hypothetical protein